MVSRAPGRDTVDAHSSAYDFDLIVRPSARVKKYARHRATDARGQIDQHAVVAVHGVNHQRHAGIHRPDQQGNCAGRRWKDVVDLDTRPVASALQINQIVCGGSRPPKVVENM